MCHGNSQETWFHGTETYFERWQVPPPALKQGLYPHSAVFLTTDRLVAEDAGANAGGLCQARVHPEARVLDMLQCSELGEEYRRNIQSSGIGKQHAYVHESDAWFQAWCNGRIFRFATTDKTLGEAMKKHEHIARTAPPGLQKAKSFQLVQNLTRSWIEELVNIARELGVDAVIGREIQRDHPCGKPTPSNLLIALNAEALTQPEWINIPR